MYGIPVLRIDRSYGFLTIEVLAVLTIVAILLAVGVPSFSSLIENSKLTATANEFFSSIILARSEAIQRGQRIDMVPLDKGGDWAKGWVVFADSNGNQMLDATEKMIFSHGPVPQGIKIESRLTDSTVKYLAYNSAGRTRTNESNFSTQFGTFTIKLDDRKVRKIKLNFLGRPRVCNPEVEKNTC